MDDRTPITRRELLAALAATGGMLLAGCSPTDPPTYGNLLRAGDLLTYKAHRLLLPRQALAREFERHDITSIPAVGTSDPADPAGAYYNAALGAEYDRLRHGGWADWRLQVEGLVAHPGSFSLADLQRMHARTQITRHTCEEGWSAIAEWTGVPLSRVLDACGVLPQARYVNFGAYDETADSIDMIDALHPQTILAWGMNGRDLPQAHGAPLRLRVERQIGYKSIKFLRRIRVTDTFEDPGRLGPIQNGWAWYTGL